MVLSCRRGHRYLPAPPISTSGATECRVRSVSSAASIFNLKKLGTNQSSPWVLTCHASRTNSIMPCGKRPEPTPPNSLTIAQIHIGNMPPGACGKTTWHRVSSRRRGVFGHRNITTTSMLKIFALFTFPYWMLLSAQSARLIPEFLPDNTAYR